MMEELYDTISAYLRQQLPAREREAFEQKMANDAQLREEVEAHRLASEAIEWSIAESLRKELASWSEPAAGSTPAAPASDAIIRPLWRRNWAIAATALIIIVAGAYLWSNQNYTNGALAEGYYPKSELAGLRSSNPTKADALAPGYEALNSGNYSEAINLFGRLTSDELLGPKALYFKAHAHFQQKQFNEAISSLSNLIQQSEGEEKDRAEWLLALSYLGAGKTAEAKILISKIAANKDHSYAPQAGQLLGDLNSLWRKII